MVEAFDRYEKDIASLIVRGGKLTIAMQRECAPNAKLVTDMTKEELDKLPSPTTNYEQWYSESLALITQLLPDRAEDFKSYYRPKNPRKDISYSNYTISDYLRSLTRRIGDEVIFGPSAALAPMYQQYNMLKGLQRRFKSSLFDIKTLVHADLLDNELQAAEELNAKGFHRGAGAVAGVVLEGHLCGVCARHGIAVKKKDPAISDFNDALKAVSVVEMSVWRFIQHLGDLRNKCDHKKTAEPTKDEVNELIAGVRKITKTVF